MKCAFIWPVSPVPQQGGDPLLQLLAHDRGAVGVEDDETAGEEVTQEPVRDELGHGGGAAFEEIMVCGVQLEPTLELVQQAGLADAGIANHGDRLALAVFSDRLEDSSGAG